jgi:hypothetical protein
MKLNPRLLLLLVMLGLFVRVWNANAPRRRGTISATGVTPTGFRDSSRPFSWRNDRIDRSPSDDRSSVHEERWTLVTCPVSIPTMLPAGIYRAASSRGRIARLEVPFSAQHGAARGVSSPFEVSTPQGERWFVIRLESGLDQVASEETADVASSGFLPGVLDIPIGTQIPFANRKFDFTGYVPARATRHPAVVVEQAERPRAPELPSPR